MQIKNRTFNYIEDDKYPSLIETIQNSEFNYVLNLLRNMANQGLAQHKYNLALYLIKTEATHSTSEIIANLTEAAEEELPQALHLLGIMYRDGSLVGQNYTESFKHFLKASQLGYKYVALDLAKSYILGEGCKINFEEADMWLARAATFSYESYDEIVSLYYSMGSLYNNSNEYRNIDMATSYFIKGINIKNRIHQIANSQVEDRRGHTSKIVITIIMLVLIYVFFF